MSSETAPLLEELQTIEENCLYTAQAHFSIAGRKGTAVKIVFIGASAMAAIAGGLVAAGLPAWLGVFSAVGGVVGAVTAALGANKDVHTHIVAANVLTKMRHEARALREAFAPTLSTDDLVREVRRFSDAYNNLIQGLPPTDAKSMERARKLIQAGQFQPDFRTGQDGAGALPQAAGAGTRALPGTGTKALPASQDKHSA